MKSKITENSSSSYDMTREPLSIEMMQDITVAERVIAEPATAWNGRCYEIAHTLSECMKGSASVYGHYLGPIDPKGYWGNQAHIPFVPHGWIIFRDNDLIMDPTRWSFEGRDPYIYYGEAHGQYDEGGNGMRSNTQPCPSFDHTKRIVRFHKATPNSALSRHLNCLIPSVRMEECLHIDNKQAFWLANTHYCRLEPFVKEIYLGLEAAGCKAFIPFDNWSRAFRKW